MQKKILQTHFVSLVAVALWSFRVLIIAPITIHRYTFDLLGNFFYYNFALNLIKFCVNNFFLFCVVFFFAFNCPDNRAFVKRGALNELWDSLELKGVEKSSYLRNKEKYFFLF